MNQSTGYAFLDEARRTGNKQVLSRAGKRGNERKKEKKLREQAEACAAEAKRWKELLEGAERDAATHANNNPDD